MEPQARARSLSFGQGPEQRSDVPAHSFESPTGMAPPVSGPSETDFEQSLDNDSDQQLYLTQKGILRRAREWIAKAKEHFE